MNKMARHIRWPGLAALATTLAAVAASPAVLDLLPKEYTAAIIAISALVQAMTKPVKREVPKE